MEIKHSFTSGKGDGPDSTLVRPSNWNAPHLITLAAASRYIGTDKTSAGAAKEIPVVSVAGADDGTIWTAAKVQEYIAAALAGVGAGDQIPMGTIVGSINGTMPGFLPLNGQTFGRVGSTSFYENDAYQQLYATIWPLSTITVEGGKGGTPEADWTAGKSMFLPQSAGCVMMAHGGIFGAAEFFTVFGANDVTLAVNNLPAHRHSYGGVGGAIKRGAVSGLGGSFTGNLLSDTGNDSPETNDTGVGTPFSIVQRSMILQVFWIKY